jgi:3-dehydroquinate synthase
MRETEWQSEPITVNYEGKPAYDILIEKDFGGLSQAVINLGMSGRKFMIVSDSNVSRYYLEECTSIFQSVTDRVESFVFDAGEASKNLDTVNECYSRLIAAGFDRNDVLVALGGGVIGDLTGFAAATYLRGIRFIQLPTSLLAMVDSSIGGKTGVDYKAYKNMVGAFHQPKLVYMNLSVLLTLKDREFYSGMGEIIKHGLIKDRSYYEWLKEHQPEIASKELAALREMVFRSCLIKKAVVEEDPKEKGDRALLNFGHTIGHSVEKLKEFSLLHGECVCIGMAAAAYLSHRRGLLTQEQLEDIMQVIQSFREPVRVNGIQADEVYEVTRLDKKMDSDRIRFILLKGIGDSFIDPTVTKEEQLQAIGFILN